MKGKSTATTYEAYIDELEPSRREQVAKLHALIREVAPELEPTMAFGMLGYGTYHFRYASGREGDWFRVGVANNKNYISLYCCGYVEGAYVAEGFKERLPKAKIGKSCVTFKRLSDLDEAALRDLIRSTADSDFAI